VILENIEQSLVIIDDLQEMIGKPWIANIIQVGSRYHYIIWFGSVANVVETSIIAFALYRASSSGFGLDLHPTT
jgi:hypothetical protein